MNSSMPITSIRKITFDQTGVVPGSLSTRNNPHIDLPAVVYKNSKYIQPTDIPVPGSNVKNRVTIEIQPKILETSSMFAALEEFLPELKDMFQLKVYLFAESPGDLWKPTTIEKMIIDEPSLLMPDRYGSWDVQAEVYLGQYLRDRVAENVDKSKTISLDSKTLKKTQTVTFYIDEPETYSYLSVVAVCMANKEAIIDGMKTPGLTFSADDYRMLCGPATVMPIVKNQQVIYNEYVNIQDFRSTRRLSPRELFDPSVLSNQLKNKKSIAALANKSTQAQLGSYMSDIIFSKDPKGRQGFYFNFDLKGYAEEKAAFLLFSDKMRIRKARMFRRKVKVHGKNGSPVSPGIIKLDPKNHDIELIDPNPTLVSDAGGGSHVGYTFATVKHGSRGVSFGPHKLMGTAYEPDPQTTPLWGGLQYSPAVDGNLPGVPNQLVFTGFDHAVINEGEGTYQYGIELEFYDSTKLGFKNLLEGHREVVRSLEGVYNDINWFGKKFYNAAAGEFTKQGHKLIAAKYEALDTVPWDEKNLQWLFDWELENETIQTIAKYLKPKSLGGSCTPDSILYVLNFYKELLTVMENKFDSVSDSKAYKKGKGVGAHVQKTGKKSGKTYVQDGYIYWFPTLTKVEPDRAKCCFIDPQRFTRPYTAADYNSDIDYSFQKQAFGLPKISYTQFMARMNFERARYFKEADANKFTWGYISAESIKIYDGKKSTEWGPYWLYGQPGFDPEQCFVAILASKHQIKENSPLSMKATKEQKKKNTTGLSLKFQALSPVLKQGIFIGSTENLTINNHFISPIGPAIVGLDGSNRGTPARSATRTPPPGGRDQQRAVEHRATEQSAATVSTSPAEKSPSVNLDSAMQTMYKAMLMGKLGESPFLIKLLNDEQKDVSLAQYVKAGFIPSQYLILAGEAEPGWDLSNPPGSWDPKMEAVLSDPKKLLHPKHLGLYWLRYENIARLEVFQGKPPNPTPDFTNISHFPKNNWTLLTKAIVESGRQANMPLLCRMVYFDSPLSLGKDNKLREAARMPMYTEHFIIQGWDTNKQVSPTGEIANTIKPALLKPPGASPAGTLPGASASPAGPANILGPAGGGGGGFSGGGFGGGY